MSRFAGLEIDRSRLRLAIFEGNTKKYTLIDFIDEDISAESEEERRELIREILREQLAKKENRGMDVVSSIDARQSVLREINVPYTKDDAIAKTIRFEAESYLHAYSVDDVVIEYLKCGETHPFSSRGH